MKTMKKTLAGLLAASLLFAEYSVISPSATASAANTVTATKSLTIIVGKKKVIKVKGTYIKSKTFIMIGSKTKIATVNQKGVVTAKKAGNCEVMITVKYRKTKKSKKLLKKNLICKITVKKAGINPSPETDSSAIATPDSTSSPTPAPTTTPAVEKNAEDVAAITAIIKEQKKSEAKRS